jgi:hypothetical protein
MWENNTNLEVLRMPMRLDAKVSPVEWSSVGRRVEWYYQPTFLFPFSPSESQSVTFLLRKFGHCVEDSALYRRDASKIYSIVGWSTVLYSHA